MSGRGHPLGHCTCRTHIDRPWRRAEHWAAAEVEYLESAYGRVRDQAIADRLGRSVLGVRLKAKRLGLRKTRMAFTGRQVEEVFGIPPADGRVGKIWIARGLLAGKRIPVRGHRDIWRIEPEAVERFIRDHPEWIDVDRMPDSPYRDLAARDIWISLREVHRRTGRDPWHVARMIAAGLIRGRRRGTHWYVPLTDVHLVPPLRSREAIEDSVFRRESTLAERRRRRLRTAGRDGHERTPVPALLDRKSA